MGSRRPAIRRSISTRLTPCVRRRWRLSRYSVNPLDPLFVGERTSIAVTRRSSGSRRISIQVSRTSSIAAAKGIAIGSSVATMPPPAGSGPPDPP